MTNNPNINQIETNDPAFTDFWELASVDPDKTLDLLVWLFTDAEQAARRYAFLVALKAYATNVDVPTTGEFLNELMAIRELGIFHAVKDGGVSLMRLCAMASAPDAMVATYEAFNNESAPWLLTTVGRPYPQELGPVVTVPMALMGGSEIPDLRPVLADGEVFGVSPDRRSFMVSCEATRLQENCPYGIVIAKCIMPDGTSTAKPVVVTQNLVSRKFEGSIPASELLGDVRSEFRKGDKLQAYCVAVADDVVIHRLTVDDIEGLLRKDPVAKNSRRIKEAIGNLIAAMKADTDGQTGGDQ